MPSYQKHLSPERSIGLATRAEFGDAVWPMRISANVTDDFGNVTPEFDSSEPLRAVASNVIKDLEAKFRNFV